MNAVSLVRLGLALSLSWPGTSCTSESGGSGPDFQILADGAGDVATQEDGRTGSDGVGDQASRFDAECPECSIGPADALDSRGLPDSPPETATPPVVGPSGEFDETIDVDGTLRSWRVHVPESAVDAMAFGPVPLLIALHGAGDSGANFLAATGLKTTAAANGFVLVGPQGYNAGWFVKTQEGWPGTDGNGSSLQNDAQLMTEILEVTSQHYWIDEARVFAVGFSRGAGLAGLLAILSGQMALPSGPWKSPFAAYGIDAGYDPMGGQVDVSLAAPKRAVWLIHGTADAGVPYNFGKSFADALQAGGWDVLFTTIDGAPHTWLWQPAFGYSNQDLWDFFAAHPADAS